MMECMLEQPCINPRWDVWGMEFLLEMFGTDVLAPLMHSDWAVDEMMAGVPAEEIESCIWEGYEKWAEEQLYEGRCYE